MTKEGKIVCPSCAAEFDKNNAKCPFCGVMYYEGAEKAYMEQLRDVKEDLSELQFVPEEEMRKEARNVGKFLRRVMIVLGVFIVLIAVGVYFFREKEMKQQKLDFIYRQANYPIFDEMYAKGEYDALAEKYNEALINGDDIWGWEHRDFISVYESIQNIENTIARLDAGEVLELNGYAGLIWDEWNVVMYVARDELDEQEKGYIDAIKDIAIEDLKTRWGLSGEELQKWYDKMAADYHIVTYSECEDFAKDWMKRNIK